MKKISYSEYFDKVYGCWLGKCIGGACGALPENNKSVHSYTLDNVFPDTIPPNDDLDLQVLWLVDVLEKKGTSFTSDDLALSFAAHNLCIANEYAVAIKNIECGIMPPYSGSFMNDYFKNSEGCPIRSEIWAVVAPGSLHTAKRLAETDGVIDHGRESIEAEAFNSVMESAAFFESDIIELIDTAIAILPHDALISKVAHLALDCYKNNIDWLSARKKIVTRFGSQDASYSIVNGGLAILALLYGEYDYGKTLLYAVNGGFDTDCTAATALSILGIITGADKTPNFWKEKIGDKLVVGTVDVNCPYKTIKSFAEATCLAGLSFARDGLTDCEITDVPENLSCSLPLPVKRDITVKVKYDGEPVIAVGGEASVTVTVTNHSDVPVSDVLSVDIAPALICETESTELCVMPRESVSRSFKFTVKDNISRFPQRNVNFFRFADESAAAGLFGAYAVNVIGPFWDNYDTTVYDSDPYGGKMQRFPDGTADIRAMFGCYVNIDKEYINEDMSGLDSILAGETDVPFVRANLHGDVFDVDSAVTYRGAACVYVVYDLYVPEDTVGTYHFGSNSPFKVWENGKLIHVNRDYFTYTPFNDSPLADLHKGVNRLVFKLTRLEHFSFSFVMRDNADKEKYTSKFESVLTK